MLSPLECKDITVKCPKCGGIYLIDSRRDGMPIYCINCKKEFVMSRCEVSNWWKMKAFLLSIIFILFCNISYAQVTQFVQRLGNCDNCVTTVGDWQSDTSYTTGSEDEWFCAVHALPDPGVCRVYHPNVEVYIDEADESDHRIRIAIYDSGEDLIFESSNYWDSGNNSVEWLDLGMFSTLSIPCEETEIWLCYILEDSATRRYYDSCTTSDAQNYNQAFGTAAPSDMSSFSTTDRCSMIRLSWP
jgi:hypothetical protein